MAVTLLAALIVTTHDHVPVQLPLQPAKTDPEVAVAVRVTAVPSPKLALQVEPQLMPAGVEVTVPDPVPALVTVSP